VETFSRQIERRRFARSVGRAASTAFDRPERVDSPSIGHRGPEWQERRHGLARGLFVKGDSLDEQSVTDLSHLRRERRAEP
jgi:hypothetical protein